MQLICHYDREYPAVVGHVGDSVVLDVSHPSLTGCVVVPFAADNVEAAARLYGRAGPEPELMGDPPTGCYPGHDKLDEAGVPDHVLTDDGKPLLDKRGVPVPHPQRALAGKPYPDRRRLAEDLRPPAAPPQSDPAVLRAYAAQKRWQLEVAGVSATVPVRSAKGEDVDTEVPVATDRESQQLLEVLAGRAARRPGGRYKFVGSDGAAYDVDGDAVVLMADAVAEHVERLRGAHAGVLTSVERGEVDSFAAVDKLLGA